MKTILTTALTMGLTLAAAAGSTVSLPVDLRESPRHLANAADFLPVTWDGGNWTGADATADVAVSLNEATARTLVDAGKGDGALAFVAFGKGTYFFTHDADGATETATFILDGPGPAAGDVASLTYDSREFTAENPRVVNSLEDDLWPIAYSGDNWAGTDAAGDATVTLTAENGNSAVVRQAAGEDDFQLLIASEGDATLSHAADAKTETAYLRFAEGVTVPGRDDLAATGGESWLNETGSLITGIDTDASGNWTVRFMPSLQDGLSFDTWYAASMLNGRLGLKTAATAGGLDKAEVQNVSSSATAGELIFNAAATAEGARTLWQVEIK